MRRFDPEGEVVTDRRFGTEGHQEKPQRVQEARQLGHGSLCKRSYLFKGKDKFEANA